MSDVIPPHSGWATHILSLSGPPSPLLPRTAIFARSGCVGVGVCERRVAHHDHQADDVASQGGKHLQARDQSSAAGPCRPGCSVESPGQAPGPSTCQPGQPASQGVRLQRRRLRRGASLNLHDPLGHCACCSTLNSSPATRRRRTNDEDEEQKATRQRGKESQSQLKVIPFFSFEQTTQPRSAIQLHRQELSLWSETIRSRAAARAIQGKSSDLSRTSEEKIHNNQ